MVEITYQNSGGRRRMTAVGHATGGPAVCAAVSGIVYALGGYLKNLEAGGEAQTGSFLLEPGHAELEAGGGAAVDCAFEMALVGLLQIERKYPDKVRVRHLKDGNPQNCRP